MPAANSSTAGAHPSFSTLSKSDLMDIRSLGPDKTIWTADDLSLDVKNVEAELRLGPEQ